MTLAVAFVALFSCTIAVVMPWLGVVLYYGLAVSQITAFWPHHFGDSRLSLYIALSIIIGLGIATAAQQVDWRRILQWPSLLMIAFIVLVNISTSISPYAGFEDVKLNIIPPSEMLELLNSIVLVYLLAVLLIDTRFKLIFMITSVVGGLFAYTVWANWIYLSGEFWRFGDNGRLNGPVQGLYTDENYLAMLFVITTPILYYLAVGVKYRVIKVALWLCIPLSWHALFLTGSRGGFLALAIACIYIACRSYSRKASVILLLAFVVAVVDQSGGLIDRLTGTVTQEDSERARAFIENDEDSPEIEYETLDPRVISWTVGLGIIADHPMFGVGIGNFLRAFNDYHPSEPHVSHNAFLQFATTGGLTAGFLYLSFLFLRLKNAVTKPDPTKTYPQGLKRDWLDDLINCTTISFYCVALFLNLMLQEITYFIMIVCFSKFALDRARSSVENLTLIESIYRWRQNELESELGPQFVTNTGQLAPNLRAGPDTRPVMGASPGAKPIYPTHIGAPADEPFRDEMASREQLASMHVNPENQYVKQAS